MSASSFLPAEVRDPARLAAVRRSGLLDSGPTVAFDRLAELAVRLLDASAAFITVVDERRAYWKACVGVTGEVRENPVRESFCQHLIQARGPVIIGDATMDPRTHDNPSVVKLGVAAWAGFPLMSPDGQVLGSFCVVDEVTREWSETEVDTLRTLADAATAEVALIDALAEERVARDTAALALRRERRAHRRAEALMRAGTAMSSHNDLASVLRALVGATVPDTGVWCAVHLRHAGGAPVLVAMGHRDARQEAAISALNEGTDSWLATHVATPVALHNREQTYLAADQDERVMGLGAAHVVSLPLRVRGRTIGALTVGVDPDAEPDAAHTIAGLAVHAAVALDNAKLYDEQVGVVRVLQEALMPGALPEIPGVQLAVRFRPAGGVIPIGGDFYDVFASDRRAAQAFVVGDVAGKGPVAATLTGVVRHTLRAAFFGGDDPQGAMALANEALYDVSHAEAFCTAVYGQIEATDRHVDIQLVRAGHPPPLLVRADGEVAAVEPDGGIIGNLPDMTWEMASVRLLPGDALVLYTDGAVELSGRQAIDGERALQDLLQHVRGVSAQELAEAIEHQSIVLSHGPLRDDLALLVIRCPPVPT